MRSYFQEGDLVVAEIQTLMSEGTMSLHTRSLKYGKVCFAALRCSAVPAKRKLQLRNGALVIVPPSLIVRLKSHFHTLACGVDVIIGMNGYVWVQAATAESSKSNDPMAEDERGEGAASMAIYSSVNDTIDQQTREAIDRVCACVRTLASASLAITDTHLANAYEASMDIRDSAGEDISTASLGQSEYATSIISAVMDGAGR